MKPQNNRMQQPVPANSLFSFSPGRYVPAITAFGLLCLCFSPLLVNFIWGNHDWLPLIHGNPLLSGLIEGRFSQYILLNLLLDGKILPVLNILLGFIFYTAALFLLYRRFFAFSVRPAIAALFLSAAAGLPFAAELLYFHFITFSLLSWPLIIALSLLCCQKASGSHPVIFTLCGTLLLLFALGGYPASVNLFVISAACFTILSLTAQPASGRTIIRQTLPFAVCLLLSMAGLKLAFSFLQEHHYMMQLYNSQASTVPELIVKLPKILKSAFEDFFQPRPFLSPFFKMLISSITLTASATFCFFAFAKSAPSADAPAYSRLCVWKKVLALLLIASLPLCLKFSAWLAKSAPDAPFAMEDPAAYMARTDFYGYPVLILFCLFYLHRFGSQVLKNFAYLSAVLLLIISINLNLNFAKTHFLGFTAENKLLERLTARIQSHQDFSRTSQYTVIQAGEIPLRSRYYLPSANEKYGYYMLQAPYTRHWIAFEYYNFYAPYDYVREGTAIRPEEITLQMADFLTKRVKTWPSADSVYVDKNYAVIALTQRGKELLTRQFELLSRQLPVSASPDANRKFSSQSSETQIPSQTPRHNPEAPRQTVNGNMP